MFDKLKKILEELGYTVSCFATAAEATAYLNGQIDQKTVGMGGSVTIDRMGLYEALAEHNQVAWHQHMPQGKTDMEVRAEENAAQIYISSVNGIAETGEIINIDGLGNRVAATCFGHEKIYLIVGQNKIAEDYDKALWRARNIAAPMNAKRLGKKTPCAVKADRCYNCSSPERICRELVVFWTKPMRIDMEIVLIQEDLGY